MKNASYRESVPIKSAMYKDALVEMGCGCDKDVFYQKWLVVTPHKPKPIFSSKQILKPNSR